MIPAAGKMSQGTKVTWRFCAMLIMLSRLHEIVRVATYPK